MTKPSPGGTTRPAMRDAMKMFKPPRVRKDGTVIESRPPRVPTPIEGQRDVFDHLLEQDIPMWDGQE